ncbi:hypothetical protein Ahy_A05g025209 [Arachis hypogaea]|uniref:SWIM-type domain-containing protein n=1 Tax=Arachis hypogaea TaxID=3818 RepID=A0A445D7W0_ARAHY|nr:hypothetical protein Ahy_A05g025209 [Arachis hypogaea]
MVHAGNTWGRADQARGGVMLRGITWGRHGDVAKLDWYTRASSGGVLMFFECVSGVLEDTAKLVVYRDGEIIRNTHEGVRFVCQNPFSFVVPWTMTFMKLQNGLCQSMENSTLMRVSRILYRNPVIVFGGLMQFDTMPITDEVTMHNMFQIHQQTQIRQPQIELYVEFETIEAEGIQNDLEVEDDRAAVYVGMSSDSEEDFEATYEAGDEEQDGDAGVETAADVVVHPSISQPMNVSPFMRKLDLDAMHAPKFPEYSNIGVADPEDGEFRIGMEYSSRKSVVAAIRSYTIARGVDYDVYESEPQTFYAKCKMYGRGCNGRHTCTTGVISQDPSKLDLDTVAEAIRPLRIEASMQQAGNIVVHRFDRRNDVFEVREMTSGKVLVVDLARRTCDCGHFQVERIPCRHVIACCANQQIDWHVYVHDVYKMTEVHKVYRFEFSPLGDAETWPAYEGPTLVANPALRRTSKGRPKLTRYLNEMDSRDMRGPWICRLCGAQGHSRSRCPQRAGSSGRKGVQIPQSSVSPVVPLHYPLPMQNYPIIKLHSAKSHAMLVSGMSLGIRGRAGGGGAVRTQTDGMSM